jgi:hypothetical protein
MLHRTAVYEEILKPNHNLLHPKCAITSIYCSIKTRRNTLKPDHNLLHPKRAIAYIAVYVRTYLKTQVFNLFRFRLCLGAEKLREKLFERTWEAEVQLDTNP